jgi:hypothetical protein
MKKAPTKPILQKLIDEPMMLVLPSGKTPGLTFITSQKVEDDGNVKEFDKTTKTDTLKSNM